MTVPWLAQVLKDAGLTVVEVAGWKIRGRPGVFGPVKGVICHHTAGKSYDRNAPSLDLITRGRSDLPGPLSQLCLGRDGTFYVVAAGRCNHAGKGFWQGISDGNRSFIGIEAENDGIGEKWPAVQLDAYKRGCAAILKHVKAPAKMVAGHREFALPKGRKIDPANIDMDDFRADVAKLMNG